MGRLTERDKHEDGIWLKDDYGAYNFFDSMDEFYPALNKLAHYEDLEEAGRLVEVKQGEWAKRSNGEIWWYECSICSGPILKNGWGHDMFSEFCPHCGAKLKELEE